MEIKITNKNDPMFYEYCDECERIAKVNLIENGGSLSMLGVYRGSTDLFLAIEDGKVIGYVSIWLGYRVSGQPYVGQMAVDEAYRNRGVCSALLTAAKEKYAGYDYMYADARGWNIKSHNTLSKNGFQVIQHPYSTEHNNLYECPLKLELEQSESETIRI